MSYSPLPSSISPAGIVAANSLGPYAIQATNPMRMSVGAMYTYPFFFQTYNPGFKCEVKQPFQAICGSAVALDLSCQPPRLPAVTYPIIFV